MDILIQAGQLILSLSILIVLHEFGHYLPARAFKTRVEKFYLFFDYKFSLFKKKINDTEWGIGWIPLGGYVKISGMIDESMDKEQMAQEPQPWEFRSKKTWQRLVIMIGGITVNLILGFIIYAMVLAVWGRDYVKYEGIENGYMFGENMEKIGFEDGDRIKQIDGEELFSYDFRAIYSQLLVRSPEDILVVHSNGEEELIATPDSMDFTLFKAGEIVFPRFHAVLDSVLVEMNGAKAGLENGDSIVKVNGQEVLFWDEMTDLIQDNEKDSVTLEYYRDGQLLSTTVETDSAGKIGVIFGGERIESLVDFSHKDYSFGESLPAGMNLAYWTLHDYAAQLKYLFTSKGASSMGGFGAFGKLFKPTWDWHTFWLNTAFISIILAFMNLLPIPALDGGHIMFLLYEMITGRQPHQKVMEYAQIIGIVLILGLVLFANGNDIYKAIVGD
jgi:regulator of sigma E protease